MSHEPSANKYHTISKHHIKTQELEKLLGQNGFGAISNYVIDVIDVSYKERVITRTMCQTPKKPTKTKGKFRKAMPIMLPNMLVGKSGSKYAFSNVFNKEKIFLHGESHLT